MQAEQVKEDNQARLDQYNAIINQKGKNIDLILGELKLAAQAWNDEMMFNAANSKQTQMIGAMLQKEQEHQDMMEYRFGNQDLANRKLQAQLDAGALGGGRGQIGIMLNKWVAAQSAAGHPPTYEEQERKLLQLNAEMREASNVGNYSAKVETAAIDAQNIIKNVLRASEAVPRGDLVAINSLAQAVAYQGSDPALIALRTHLNALRSVYVRVMNPTSNATEGPRVETHINGLFEAALGPGGLQSQVQAIEQEIESQRSATKQMRDQLGSDAEIPSGESMFERALRDAHAPNRLQDQQGGANVDPYEGITVKVK
jgi:hypothetical protein